MAMDAILMRDYPVVQAYVVWTALIFTCVNLITDLLLHQLEPQARQFILKGGGWRTDPQNRPPHGLHKTCWLLLLTVLLVLVTLQRALLGTSRSLSAKP